MCSAFGSWWDVCRAAALPAAPCLRRDEGDWGWQAAERLFTCSWFLNPVKTNGNRAPQLRHGWPSARSPRWSCHTLHAPSSSSRPHRLHGSYLNRPFSFSSERRRGFCEHLASLAADVLVCSEEDKFLTACFEGNSVSLLKISSTEMRKMQLINSACAD